MDGELYNEIQGMFMEAKDEMMGREEWDRLDTLEKKVLKVIEDADSTSL